MKIIKKIAMLAILGGLATTSYASSLIKVICDRDGESIYLNNQFKSTCDSGEPVSMIAKAGRYTVVVKKYNGNGSYYNYKKSFRIGDNLQKIVEVNSEIHYAEKYYYSKAKKSGKAKDYWTYLKEYPHGKYVATVKNYLDKYYWDRCNSIDNCKTYLSKITWGKYKSQAKQKLEDLYYKKANRVFYDKDTGLIWQDNKDAKTIKRDWNGAKEYCKNLTLGGYSDWRLPNKKELVSIVDRTKYPSIKTGFKNVAFYSYWSSSEDVSDGSNVWRVNFYVGNAYSDRKSSKDGVRCVRGRQ